MVAEARDMHAWLARFEGSRYSGEARITRRRTAIRRALKGVSGKEFALRADALDGSI
jgi:hypothetical protein